MAFTGVAIYDSGVYNNEIGEDVSATVSLISPSKTPFLDDIGDSGSSITSKLYSWEEDSLLPDTYSNSSAIASNAGAAIGIEIGANAGYLRVNDILASQDAPYENMKVVSIGTSAATIFVQRAYAGTTASSLAAGVTIDFRGSALEEGAGAREQRRVNKILKSNYVQTFREDINMSTLFANTKFKAANQGDPLEEQKTKSTIEVMKQLEKAVVMGRTNGNTIGASGAETTMAGFYHSITTNITSHATFSNSIFNNVLEQVNDNTDLKGDISEYAVYGGITAFRQLSTERTGRVQSTQEATEGGIKRITTYASDFGDMPVSQLRWLPKDALVVLRKDFLNIKPFAGNSFQFKSFDDGKLAEQGYVAGTYGLEFRHEKAHGILRGIA